MKGISAPLTESAFLHGLGRLQTSNSIKSQSTPVIVNYRKRTIIDSQQWRILRRAFELFNERCWSKAAIEEID